MGLGDMYSSDQAQSIATGAERRTADGFSSLPGLQMQDLKNKEQAQSNTDQAYNSPARPATHSETAIADYVRKMMDGPPEFVNRLKQEVGRGGGLSAGGSSGTPSPAPQGAPQYQGPMAPPAQNQGSMMGASQTQGTPQFPMNAQAPSSMGGYGMDAAQPGQDRTVQVNLPPNGGQGLSNQSPDLSDTVSKMKRVQSWDTVPPPQRTMNSMAPARPPQSQVKVPQPMTRGDVSEYLRMAPFISSESKERIAMNKPAGGLTFEQRLALDNNKGDQARKTLDQKQTGEINLDSVRGTRQKLMKAAELALGYKQLDETTARHVDQFNTDLAKLENMARFQDRLLDTKASSGRDEMLNNMRQTVTSLMSSKAQLTASGFGGTPLGQEFLKSADETLAGPQRILQDYEDGKRAPPTQQPGGIRSQSTSTTATQRPPLPQVTPRTSPRQIGVTGAPEAAPPTGPFKFRLKADTAYGKAGSTGQADSADYDPKVMQIVR